MVLIGSVELDARLDEAVEYGGLDLGVTRWPMPALPAGVGWGAAEKRRRGGQLTALAQPKSSARIMRICRADRAVRATGDRAAGGRRRTTAADRLAPPPARLAWCGEWGREGRSTHVRLRGVVRRGARAV